MKHFDLRHRLLVTTAGLVTVMLSACCPGSYCSNNTPNPPRSPPAQHLTWLSKKSNSPVEATSYYREIGAITTVNGVDRLETLADFKSRNGFNVNDGTEVETTYYNEADLRFGRDMHCRRRPAQAGIIACYVVNYGPSPVDLDPTGNRLWPNQALSLSDAVAKQHPFATVAMEARNVQELTTAVVLESNGDAPPNLVCGTVGNAPTLCDLRDADTGLNVFPGDSVAIAATGAIWSGIWLAATNGPGGDTTRSTNANFPLPSAIPFSLIGRLGPGFSYFPVGASTVITNTTNVAQRLFLRTNDDVPANGSGSFSVAITYLNRVNFFTYGKNDVLAAEAALDIEGGKPTPGICMACHGGTFDRATKPGSLVVNGATFLPFDVQSFTFAGSAGFGLDDQQEAFRKLNALVIESRPNERNTNRPIAAFINSLYQTGPGGVHGVGNKAGNAVTPAGWQGHDTAYQWISKPYCQMCHMALDESKDFSTFANFNINKVLIEADVCNGSVRSMPHAQVPFEKFWKITVPDAAAGLADIGIANCKP